MDEKWNIKISDFGITSLLQEEEDNDNSLVGTMSYIAPEVRMQMNRRIANIL